MDAPMDMPTPWTIIAVVLGALAVINVVVMMICIWLDYWRWIALDKESRPGKWAVIRRSILNSLWLTGFVAAIFAILFALALNPSGWINKHRGFLDDRRYGHTVNE